MKRRSIPRRLLIVIPLVVGMILVGIFMPSRQVTIEGFGTLSFDTTVTLSVGSEAAYAHPAAPAYQSFTEANSGPVSGPPNNVTSIVVNKPAGTASGDLLIGVVVTDDDAGTFTPPSGWALINAGTNGSLVTVGSWYKIAGGSEPASYTWSWTNPQTVYAFIIRITGHDSSNPINVSGFATGNSITPTCPDVNTTVADTLVLRIFGANWAQVTVDGGYPSGHTGITVDVSGDPSQPGQCSGGAAYTTQATAGATGTAAFTMTNAHEWRALTIAIAPPTTFAYYDVISALNPDFWWRLDGDENDSADAAHSDGGDDPSWVSSIIPSISSTNQCGDYNGSSDETLIPNQNDINDSTTYEKSISVWIVADTIDTSGGGRVIWGEGGSQNGLALYVLNEGGEDRLYFCVYEGTDIDYIYTTISTGTLYHVGATLDCYTEEMHLYLNGSQVASKTGGLNIGTDFATHAAGVAIGGVDSTLNNHNDANLDGAFDGRIADVVYWGEQSVLSESDFDSIYDAGISTDEPPAAPTLYNIPFEYEQTADLTPAFRFSATDPDGTDDIHYQVQIDDDHNFASTFFDHDSSSNPSYFSNITTPADNPPFNEGDVIEYVPPSDLTDDTVWFWRVRAQEDGESWGEWTEIASGYYCSVSTDDSLSNSRWFQTADEQFETGNLTGVETSSGDVQIIAGATNSHSLDCTGGYMVVGNGTPDWGSTSGTISFWIKFDSATTGRPWGQSGDFESRLDDVYVGNIMLDWGSDDTLLSGTTFTTGKWYFVAYTWNEATDTLRIYVGDETTSPTLDAENSSWTDTLTEAVVENNFMSARGGTEPVDGHGDDLRYWNTDRSLSEIQSDYNQELTGSEPNLVNYYQLDNDFTDSAGSDDGSGSGSYSFSTDVPTFTGGTGTIVSRTIDYDWLTGATDWGQLIFTDDESAGDIKYDIEYWDGGSWADTSIVNQDSSPVDISALDGTTHNQIRIEATLTYVGGTPYLNDWAIAWSVGGAAADISNSPSSIDFGTVTASSTPNTGNDYFTITNNSTMTIDIYIKCNGWSPTTGSNSWIYGSPIGADRGFLEASSADGGAGGSGGAGMYDIEILNGTDTLLCDDVATTTNPTWELQLNVPSSFTHGDEQQTTVTLTATAA